MILSVCHITSWAGATHSPALSLPSVTGVLLAVTDASNHFLSFLVVEKLVCVFHCVCVCV